MPELHAQNRGFRWREHRGPYRRITPEQAEQYDREGWFVIPDAFDADTIAELTAAIDPIEAQLEQVVRDKLGGKAFIMRAGEISFTPHVVTRSAVARAFTKHSFFQDLCADLIGPDVRLYWDQSVYKKPAAHDGFPWHQDNGYTYIEPQDYLTCWVALTDATEANGCPWVWPGRHRLGTLAHETSDLGFVCAKEPDDAVAAPVPAGGVVVFSSLTPHATGPNRTDRVRKSYIVQYAPDGAELVRSEDGHETREPCRAPERQYPILVGGEPVDDAS